MLHLLKAVASYLQQTTQVDFASPMLHGQDLGRIGSLVYGGNLQGDPGVLRDDQLYPGVLSSYSDNDGRYFGYQWSSPVMVDGFRVYSLHNDHEVLVQTFDGYNWTDGLSGGAVAMQQGWNAIPLDQKAVVGGARLRWYSGNQPQLYFSELQVFESAQIRVRPSSWPSNASFQIITTDADLESIAALPTIAIGAAGSSEDTQQMGLDESYTPGPCWVGIFAPSEDVLETLSAWLRLVLKTAQMEWSDGLPLIVQNHPMQRVLGGRIPVFESWQSPWVQDYGVTLSVDGVPTVFVPSDPTEFVDWNRGAIWTNQFATNDVRATFCAGVRQFRLTEQARPTTTDPTQKLHQHARYFLLDFEVGHLLRGGF